MIFFKIFNLCVHMILVNTKYLVIMVKNRWISIE